MSDIDFTGDVPETLPQQRCSICHALLSGYNKTGQCFRHDVAAQLDKEQDRVNKPIEAALADFRLEFDRQEQADFIEYLVVSKLTETAIATNDGPLTKMEVARRMGFADPEVVTQCVCEEYGVTAQQLHDHYRGASVMTARQVLMYLLYNDARISYPDIGERMGGRDHTTVIHGARKIESSLALDENLAETVERIRSKYRLAEG